MLKFIKKLTKEKIQDNYYGKIILQEEEGNSLIGRLLRNDKPLMIARIGYTELSCLNNYLERRKNNKKYEKIVKTAMSEWSGFFPAEDEMLDRFSEEFLEHLKNSDVIGVWFNKNEDYICFNYCKNAKLVRLRSIEPYYHASPWSLSLKDRKVLVVHPFAETIFSQYTKKRKLLFENPEVLPSFQLETIKAVQTIAGNKSVFDDWFQAYQYMCDEISKRDFDVAIIGAGAYGLPLASFVKKLGKKAVHMAGATQILFGIKGQRWDKHEVISKYYNKHWVRPSQNETPDGYIKVENGCYW